MISFPLAHYQPDQEKYILKIIIDTDSYRVVVRVVGVIVLSPAHGSVFVSGSSLTGHGSVESGVEVGGGVRSGVPDDNKLLFN